MPGLLSGLSIGTARTLSQSLMALAAVSASAGVARAQFEGTITMRVNAERGNPSDMVWSVKGNRARMDVSSAGGAMYMIREGDKTTMVMPAQHMYMDQTMTATVSQEVRAKMDKADVQFTGRKETIAGYECEHVIVTGDEDKSKEDVCLAKGLGTFMMPANPMGRGRGAQDSPMAGLMRKLDGAVFPLKVQKVGGPVELEVTRIEKKSLDNSMFTVPSDYRKFDMGAMMRRPPT